MAWANSIDAITLFMDDLEGAKGFYERVFGQAAVFEDADSVVFKIGEQFVNLLRTEAAPELIAPAQVAPAHGGARFQFTIPVSDVDAMCEELRARGVTLLNGPMDRPWGVRTASFQDPGGYIWEIAR